MKALGLLVILLAAIASLGIASAQTISINPYAISQQTSVQTTATCIGTPPCFYNPPNYGAVNIFDSGGSACPSSLPSVTACCPGGSCAGQNYDLATVKTPCGIQFGTLSSSGSYQFSMTVLSSSGTQTTHNICMYYETSSGSPQYALGAQGTLTYNPTLSGTESLTISPTPVASGSTFTMTGSCSGSGCQGPTDIYGGYPAGGSCPSSPPVTTGCGLDFSKFPAGCFFTNGQGTSASLAPGAFSTSQSATQLICSYTQGPSSTTFYSTGTLMTVCASGDTSCLSGGGGGGGGGGGSGQLPPGIASAICGVYFAVNTLVFVIALTLMILGGALYGGSQILPGQSRGTVQGYAMGLVLGGVVGAIIAILAPWILSVVSSTTVASILSTCS